MLLVVYADYVSEAEELFADLGINIVCTHRLVGGILGSHLGKRTLVENLVKEWISELKCLTMILSSQPQAPFTAFSNSLQFLDLHLTGGR